METLTYLKRCLLGIGAGLLWASLGNAAYVGPTPDITKVANAISVGHKSLTTAVIVGAGLNLTQPVEISIGFYSPFGNERITQSYAAGPGNSFLHHDGQGNGLARQLRVDITLSEKKPAGGVYTFPMASTVTLDPSYRVAIGPLKFTLIDDCDLVGNNEIYLSWIDSGNMYHKRSFTTPTSRENLIKEFYWSAAEVSPSQQLGLPAIQFEEVDSGFVDFVNLTVTCLQSARECGEFARATPAGGPAAPDRVLVPRASQLVKGNLKEKHKQCPAYYEYLYQSYVNYYDALTMAKFMANPSVATK
jgi:hypothetical protein